ncbi:dienelactone hydrolase family protein [Corynebacterium lowii]|uniref:Alpha/beta hydrolase family protein n=1 Tax=Corynebacterium lowii TaxID=1544413 RepID=A0A0Q1E3W0_9CORY|nr:dienelactone hydrolase family protein [Corynebacterium lowii]KQB87430.1 Alpha/beta hydrolase family protein [Corynebacterium lowii]MDP9851978.1 dienelactone hydrolase [Corynebacterium lowii]
MSENLNKHLPKLSKRGPHRVLVGDLAYAGLPGKVYTPAEGNGIPAVAFGHDWITNIKAYHATLRHLASWGIAVAAPDTQTGFNPDHRSLAADLNTSLQILAGVKLGHGNVIVSPGKLGLVGHGMGAGAAVLASANEEKVRAVVCAYPAVTSPSAEEAARAVNAPGLILGSGRDRLLDAGNPARVAHNWKGEVAYRELNDGTQQGFSENTLRNLLIGAAGPQHAAKETARGLITGFLLHQLAGEKKYSGFSAAEATAKKVESFSAEEIEEKANANRKVSMPL